jgi:hypothetical protein
VQWKRPVARSTAPGDAGLNRILPDGSLAFFRVDRREHDYIFAHGFEPKGTNNNLQGSGKNLQNYVNFNHPIDGVSATRSPKAAVQIAIRTGARNIFVGRREGDFFDVNDELRRQGYKNPNAREKEILFKNGIPKEIIFGVVRIDMFGNPVGELVLNEGYKPPTFPGGSGTAAVDKKGVADEAHIPAGSGMAVRHESPSASSGVLADAKVFSKLAPHVTIEYDLEQAPGFAGKVEDALRKLMNAPIGRRLVREVDERSRKGKGITIRYSAQVRTVPRLTRKQSQKHVGVPEGDDAKAMELSTKKGFGRKGEGTAAVVNWNPDLGWKVDVRDSVPFSSGDASAAWLALANELLHARAMQKGTVIGHQGERYDEGLSAGKEEQRIVGVGDFLFKPFTENSIRAEQGEPFRSSKPVLAMSELEKYQRQKGLDRAESFQIRRQLSLLLGLYDSYAFGDTLQKISLAGLRDLYKKAKDIADQQGSDAGALIKDLLAKSYDVETFSIIERMARAEQQEKAKARARKEEKEAQCRVTTALEELARGVTAKSTENTLADERFHAWRGQQDALYDADQAARKYKNENTSTWSTYSPAAQRAPSTTVVKEELEFQAARGVDKDDDSLDAWHKGYNAMEEEFRKEMAYLESLQETSERLWQQSEAREKRLAIARSQEENLRCATDDIFKRMERLDRRFGD